MSILDFKAPAVNHLFQSWLLESFWFLVIHTMVVTKCDMNERRNVFREDENCIYIHFIRKYQPLLKIAKIT